MNNNILYPLVDLDIRAIIQEEADKLIKTFNLLEMQVIELANNKSEYLLNIVPDKAVISSRFGSYTRWLTDGDWRFPGLERVCGRPKSLGLKWKGLQSGRKSGKSGTLEWLKIFGNAETSLQAATN